MAARATAIAIIAFSVVVVSSSYKDYEESCLAAHNIYRAMHTDTPKMALDDKLNQQAKACAEYYAEIGRIDHSCTQKYDAGENLAWYRNEEDNLPRLSISAVTLFYGEIIMYNYSNPGFSHETGHFTQLIWAESTKLGVGIVKHENEHFVVTLYLKAGNELSRKAFEANVQPRK